MIKIQTLRIVDRPKTCIVRNHTVHVCIPPLRTIRHTQRRRARHTPSCKQKGLTSYNKLFTASACFSTARQQTSDGSTEVLHNAACHSVCCNTSRRLAVTQTTPGSAPAFGTNMFAAFLKGIMAFGSSQ